MIYCLGRIYLDNRTDWWYVELLWSSYVNCSGIFQFSSCPFLLYFQWRLLIIFYLKKRQFSCFFVQEYWVEGFFVNNTVLIMVWILNVMPSNFLTIWGGGCICLHPCTMYRVSVPHQIELRKKCFMNNDVSCKNIYLNGNI